MESWVNDTSNLVFMYTPNPSICATVKLINKNRGDACHPMLPYLAQGANSSLEDGAILGGLLGHLKSKSHLPQVLRLYEGLRKSRGEAVVREAFKQVLYLFFAN